MSSRMILSLPSDLVAAFASNAKKELPRVLAFHRAQGNDETVNAVERAAEATNSL